MTGLTETLNEDRRLQPWVRRQTVVTTGDEVTQIFSQWFEQATMRRTLIAGSKNDCIVTVAFNGAGGDVIEPKFDLPPS